MVNKIVEKEGMKLIFTSFLSERPSLNAKRPTIFAELAGIVGGDDITNSETDLIAYKSPGLTRGVPMRRSTFASGEHTVVLCDFAVYPETTEEVQEVLKVANRWKIPVTPYAGGSGLGISAPFGGIILDIKKLDKIIEIDEISHTVTVEAGIYIHDLEIELNKAGYEMEHYPASYYCSTIGGFIANRSAGRLSTKYGKIEKMVLGMKVVLPQGEIFETPKVPAHASGPDLNNLFIGMGGTIGITTEATIKIYPIPEVRKFKSYLLPNLDAGFDAMRQIMQDDLNPCMARLYDAIETDSHLFKHSLVTENGLKRIAERKNWCYLIIGFDGKKEIVDLVFKYANEICKDHGAEDLGYEEGQFWWDHALDDYYKGNERPTRSSQFFPDDTPYIGGVFDYNVPMKYIKTVWKETEEALKKEFPDSIMYGHFSHWYKTATMMYPMIYIWNLPDNPKELSIAYNKATDIVLNTAMKYGGAFQHHHGVGRIYSRFMEKQWGKAGWQLIKDIKKNLDPNGILNPGNMGFEVM